MSEHIDFSQRDPHPSLDALFHERWSPRAYAETPVNADDLALVIEAARWSPSCFNEQPWRFWTSNEETHAQFLELLVEGNQVWAKQAPVIGVIGAFKTHAANGNPNGWAVFDAGAAWMAMNMQARKLGLYAHGMAGVHFDAVYEALDIDREQIEVVCAFTLGSIGDPERLPEMLQEREKPTPRKPIDEIWLQK